MSTSYQGHEGPLAGKMSWAPPNTPWGKLLLTAAILFALAIQIQLTVPLGASAVRLNLADLLAGPLALWALWHFLRDPGGNLRALTLPVVAGIAAVTVMFTIALAIAFSAGGLTVWGAVKYIGWFALIAYLLAGFGLARHAGPMVLKAAVLALTFGFAALALAQLVSLTFSLDLFPGQISRFYGLSANPNALSLMFVCAFILSLSIATEERRWRAAVTAAASLNLVGIILTGSLTAFLALPFALIAMFVLGVGWRRLGAVVAIAILCLLPTRLVWQGGSLHIAYDVSQLSFGATENKLGTLLQGEEGNAHLYNQSVGVRLESLRRGFADWQDAPLFGIGLGSHLRKEQARAETPQQAIQIHNTTVWLLAETGLAGLLAAAALFLALMSAFARAARADGGRLRLEGSLPVAALVILGTALIMSAAHEVMYQRIIWVVFGFALGAAPASDKGRAQTARP